MTDFFKKNENTEPEPVVLYYDIFMDMIKEIEENYLATIANSDNIYNIEYMTNSFLYEWLSFYGVEFQENQFENFNRNALKRWKAFLRTRGEEQTLMSVLSSGGSLFGYSKYKIWIYWWDNVPKWVEANPQDGYIYVVCQNREVIKTNDLIDSVKPAGYCFDILYRNDSIPIYPYYGDLRFGYGTPTSNDYPTEYQLYKSNAEERGYETDEEIYGNWGSFDYEKVSGLTLDSNGFFGGYTPITVPAGYPSPFQTVDVITGDGRKSLSAEDLVSKFQQCVQFDYNAETGEFDIPVGHISNRTTVITRDLGYDINNGYVFDDYGTKSDGTIDEHITNVDDYVYEVVGFYKSNSLGIETWRSDSSYTGIASARSFCLDIPFDTRKDGKVNFRFCLSSSSSPENQGIIEIYVNDRKVKLIYGGDISYNEWHLYTCSVSEDIGLYPRSTIKIVYSRWSENEALDIDLSNICLRESLVCSDRAISTENDVIAKEDIVFHRNWSFETLYRNNLSMETLYYQYNDKKLEWFKGVLSYDNLDSTSVYKFIPIVEDGIPCMRSEPGHVSTSVVNETMCFYLHLDEPKTLSIRYKHRTNQSRYLAIRVDSREGSATYPDNQIRENWFSWSYTYTAGDHYINFRNASSNSSVDYSIIDLSDFEPYFIDKTTDPANQPYVVQAPDIPNPRYNPPEIGIQPVKYPDGVYMYLPSGRALSSSALAGVVATANNMSSAEAQSVVSSFITTQNNQEKLNADFSIFGTWDGTTWTPVVLSADNYNAYETVISNWDESLLGDKPSETEAWPPPVPFDLLTGLMYHYGFGEIGTPSWTSDGGAGSTFELSTRTSATGGVSGHIGGGVSLTAGDAKIYRSAANETIDGVPIKFGVKNYDWSASVWLIGTDSSDTNDFRRSALALNATGGSSNVVTLGTLDGKAALMLGYTDGALISANSDILDGEWHLLVATHDTSAETVTFWLDGVIVGTTSDASLGTSSSNISNPFFGGRTNWSAVALSLVGAIDEIALWHGRAIGQSEVIALWNNGDGLPFEDWI